jgi:phosphopantetheinyl transferase (holo-ACP synthase)
MSKLIKIIHNAETNEIIEREYTDEEMAQYELDVAKEEAKRSEALAKAAAKEALLDRLGITAEEAALLLS